MRKREFFHHKYWGQETCLTPKLYKFVIEFFFPLYESN